MFYSCANTLLGLLLLLHGGSHQIYAGPGASGDYAVRVDRVTGVKTRSFNTLPGNGAFSRITGLTNYWDDEFYVISEKDEYPNRFFAVDIDLASQVTLGYVRNLTLPDTEDGDSPGANAGLLAPQAIAYDSSNKLYIAHDNDKITLFDRDMGVLWKSNFTESSRLTYGANKGIKSLSLDPGNSAIIWAASELEANEDGSHPWIRFTAINRDTKAVDAQYVYERDTLTDFNSGVVSIIALDEQSSFLVLERFESTVTGAFQAKIYFAHCDSALNVATYDSGLGEFDGIKNTLEKELVAIVGDYVNSTVVGNFESMALRSYDETEATIVLVSNNRGNVDIPTQILTLDLNMTVSGVALAEQETIGEVQKPWEDGDERAINAKAWIDPEDPALSIIFGTLGSVGVGAYDLTGTLQGVPTKHDTTVDYYDVDVLYAFPVYNSSDNFGLELLDLVIVSDRENHGIIIYKVDPLDGQLSIMPLRENAWIPSPELVAAYTSPYTGRSYVFVSNDEYVFQLELQSTFDGRISVSRITRAGGSRFELDSTCLGMVVDRENGYLYASVEGEGIGKFNAEPDESDTMTLLSNLPTPSSSLDSYNGLDIYYGMNYDGYIIASHSSDSSFAVFDRNGDHDFHGFFHVGTAYDSDDADGTIDKVDGADAIGLVNVNLGKEFSHGLMVVNDMNDEHPTFGFQNNVVINRQSNFKLVPMESINAALPDSLTLDAQSWGPRKFALVRLIDAIAQEVYVAFSSGQFSPRDAEGLLGYLGMAAWYLYNPGSQRRRLMSPGGGRAEFDFKQKKPHRLLQADRPKHHHGEATKNETQTELYDFVDLIYDLEDRGRVGNLHYTRIDDWVVRDLAIAWALPAY